MAVRLLFFYFTSPSFALDRVTGDVTWLGPQSRHSRLCDIWKGSVSAECYCEWRGATLECEFRDVPPGSYSIDLEVIDTRCKRNTLWTIGTDPCIWRHDPIIVKNGTRSLDSESVEWSSIPEYWVFALVATALGALCLSAYFGWSKRKSTIISPRRDEHEIPDAGRLLLPPRVFLLYPRDCKPFMDVMRQLRTLLKLSLNAEVYDIWDDKIRDSIDERGEIWGLEKLTSDEVLVLIAATPVSRKIEEALVNGYKISYPVPDSRDEIFISAYKTAVGQYRILREPCMKFIVMRIDSPGCAENILQIFAAPLSTIYTLPGHLDCLLKHLTGCRSLDQTFSVYNAEELQKTISAYQDFISRKPHDQELIISLT